MEICLYRLEPLVQRIKDKRSAVLCPMIDAINDETIAYPDYTGSVQVGGFSWSLFFTWEDIPDRDKQKTPIDIVRSELLCDGISFLTHSSFTLTILVFFLLWSLLHSASHVYFC